MARADLSRRVEKVVAYPPLSEMSNLQRREFHEALLEAASCEDLPGKWQGDPGGGAESAEPAARQRRLGVVECPYLEATLRPRTVVEWVFSRARCGRYLHQ